jgi:hypothetical protein
MNIPDEILKAIRRQIGVAFPTATIADPWEDPLSGDFVFHIRTSGGRLRVIVTEHVVQETDDVRDVQALIIRLKTLPDQLRQLKSGGSLTIAPDGFVRESGARKRP